MATLDEIKRLERELDSGVQQYETTEDRRYFDGYTDGIAHAIAMLRSTTRVGEINAAFHRVKQVTA